MANNINILVYRSTRSNLDIARDKIITELSKLSDSGIKVNYNKTDDIVTVYRTANECMKIWFVSYRNSEKYTSNNILSLRPVQFKYYNIGYSQDSNVDIIIKHGAFGTELWRLHHVINTIVDFAVDQKEDDKNRTKAKHRFGDHVSTPIGTTIDTSIIDGSLTATCTLTDKAMNELIRALTPMPEININLFIKDVIYNDPATIIFWRNGTKTVVKVDDEEYDPEKGLAMAFCKKMFGNKGNYYNVFKKWLPKETEEK